MVTENTNEEDIFRHALQLEDRDEQRGYVERACGEDAELCAAVEALLRQHYESSILDAPALESLFIHETTPLSEGPGTVIGRYKLLERIGEGGMAVVYMAEQEEPIRRKVALKIIKLGMDTRQVIARFEAERQALAMMDHSNIARVFDAGATETGRPYFAMELVTGVSITEYCDKNNLSTKDRLALFIQVCQAVQHAHQKGIIHRDIKPSNIMVTQRDGTPVPKVIDFGIAKATNQKLTEKTLFTRYAHIVGTPAYMSPEQAELSDLDVDTRSDIYSLGVLLYELLTGATPFSEEELREAGYLEMQRIIREDEPVKPSTKLSTLGETLTDIAKRRSCTPDLLTRTVRGDLDWIVMKALEKGRARRYETAHAFAIDVQRHLDSEPVLARGPSAAYRLQKLLHRHRVQVCAIVTITVVAVAMGIVLSMWNRARLQLSEAERLRDLGILSQAREQHARGERDAALETIESILASEHVGPEAQLLRAGILVDSRHSEEAVAVLEGLLDKQPEIAGAAHALLARILWENASPDANGLQEIEGHRQKAEALLPQTAEAYFLRAMTALTVKEQLASLDRALQLDPSDYESRRLRAFTYSASRKYDRLQGEALVMTVLRPRDPLGYSLRAAAWHELGQYPEAIADYDQAIAFTSPSDPQYANLIAQRSEVFLHKGEYERVITEAELDNHDLPLLQYHAFCALTALGRHEEAGALYRQITAPGHEARQAFEQWCMKYVFDTLAARRLWHPAGEHPPGPAFRPLVEGEEAYHALVAKGGHRLTTSGFTAQWSPDGKKLAFSLGVQGYSGVALFDPATAETELLIVPGKDPRWSPDGKYIAFIRDRQNLRLEELLTPEPGRQQPPMTDEELWIMNADGTAPRRLAQGSWPSWGRDSASLYYLSRKNGTLSRLSLANQAGESKPIMKWSYFPPSVSPDNRHVAHFEGGSLKITDLVSQKVVATHSAPPMSWGVTGWSPSGNEVCLGGGNPERDSIGLWLYDVQTGDFRRVLHGQITASCWSPAGTELTFCLGTPYREIWSVPLDPGVPTAESLGPGQTLDEHLERMVAYYTRRIEADPNDAYAYSNRAQYYDRLGNRAKAIGDMRRWSIVASGVALKDVMPEIPRDLRRVINLPFDYEIVFSAERPVNAMSMISVAFGQKEGCKMKWFKMPMVVMSLFGWGLFSGMEASPAWADFTFGECVNMRSTIPVLDPWYDTVGWPSSDGLEMYFESWERPGGYGLSDIWVLKRDSTEEDWRPPENLGPLFNSSESEAFPCLSYDGLELYFTATNRAGGFGGTDIYVTTRATRNAAWEAPVNLGPIINTASMDAGPCLSLDGLELYFQSKCPGGYGGSDIYVTRRASPNDPWGEPENLGPQVNSPYHDGCPAVSPDGLSLIFADFDWTSPPRPGGYGGTDLWMTRRANLSAPWQPAVNLGPKINTSGHELGGGICPDGVTMVFCTLRSGVFDNWQTPILPVVDFNGDGKVNGKDVVVLTQHWGQSDSVCDIGPYAWGDGIVDEQDLFMLAEYLEEDVNDPTLVAHWALDETEGAVACDCVGGCDAMVMGDAAWQPDGGVFGGALTFDGVDDCLVTDPVPELSAGPFSILAWVKGGTPDEVIVSGGAADWLYTNPADGSLMTALGSIAGNGVPLFSNVVITDGRWHRIGLLWDGTSRILLVDEQEVARDEQAEMAIPDAGLIIGAGAAANRFFSGQIDDLRIYRRAVKP